MEIINETEYRKRLKAGVKGAFVFYGEEDYMKSYAVKLTRQVVCPDESFACFNDIVIDFPDFSIDGLLRALEAPPMMAERKTVVLKSFDFGALKPTEVEAMLKILEAYGSDELNVLIVSVIPEGIDAGYSPKKPSAFMQKIIKHATAVYFEASNAAKLSVWVSRHFEHNKIHITDKMARFFIEYCGTSMMELASEIDKLSSYLHSKGRDIVTEEDIRFVNVPERSFDTFALSNALMDGNRAAALDALDVLKFRQTKVEFIMAEISGLYVHMYMVKLLKENGLAQSDITKIFSASKNYRVADFKVGLFLAAVERMSFAQLIRALDLCRDADLAMKTYGKRNYEQVERLICLL